MLLGVTSAQAQIVIGGNVYGGGNAGDTGGRSTVTVYSGDLHNVYGGARQANVGGGAFLHIDGEHASNYIVIDKAYGGNDIAGTIGSPEDVSKAVPAELTEVGTAPGKNNIDATWNAFVPSCFCQLLDSRSYPESCVQIYRRFEADAQSHCSPEHVRC